MINCDYSHKGFDSAFLNSLNGLNVLKFQNEQTQQLQ